MDARLVAWNNLRHGFLRDEYYFACLLLLDLLIIKIWNRDKNWKGDIITILLKQFLILDKSKSKYTFIFWYYLGKRHFFFHCLYSVFHRWQSHRLIELSERRIFGGFFSFKKEINLSVSFGFIRFYPLQLPNFLSEPTGFRISLARFSNHLTGAFQWNTLFIGWNNRRFLREKRYVSWIISIVDDSRIVISGIIIFHFDNSWDEIKCIFLFFEKNINHVSG